QDASITTGPTTVLGPSGSPTGSAASIWVTPSTTWSWISSATSSRVPRPHPWPARATQPIMTACIRPMDRSASGMRMLADLPPSSSEGLDGLAGGGDDLLRRLDATGERHLAHVGVADEAVAGLGRAGDDIDHAGRDPGLQRQFGEAHRRERRQLRGLEHDGVAGGEGGSD